MIDLSIAAMDPEWLRDLPPVLLAGLALAWYLCAGLAVFLSPFLVFCIFGWSGRWRKQAKAQAGQLDAMLAQGSKTASATWETGERQAAQLAGINAKLEKLIELLAAPR
ncbi:MAG: hypothetical protein ACE15C_08495 [Phycisphaerae bacterium]